MPKRYSLNPNVILRSEPQYYNTYAAFDCNTVRTELLTQDEYRILQQIRSKSIKASEISRETGIEEKRCQKFLNRISKLGYARVNADSFGVQQPERVKADPTLYGRFILPFLSAPTSVDLFITSRCNLDCVHCFSSSKDHAVHDLAVEEIEALLNQFEQLGVFELRINGGEPLLHPRIDEIMRMLKQKRLRKVILTNGTELDEEKVRLLKESEVTPTVSVDDSNMEGHDLFRGVKGSFQRTVEAVKLLQKHGVEYGINCCLHKRNLGNHRKMIDLAVKHGARRIAFLDLKPSLKMNRNIEWRPSYNEYQKVLPELMLDRMRYMKKIDVALDTFLTCRPLEESVSEAGRGYVCCQAGRSRLSIDSNGLTYPCNLVISDPKWSMGDTRKQTVSEIWFSDKWSFFRGKVRRSDLKKCKDCKNIMECRDFYCRLLPYLMNGDPYGPHPKCIQAKVRNVKAQA